MESLVKEDSPGQKCVDTLFPVHELCDSQIDRVAGQDVRFLAAETLLLAQQIHHLVDGDPSCYFKIFVKSHGDKVSRRFGARPEKSLSFADRQLQCAAQ